MAQGGSIQEIVPILDAAVKKLEDSFRIHRVYVFGSYAQGRATSDSDIDIAVVSPDFGKNVIKEGSKVLLLLAKVDTRFEPKVYSIQEYEETEPGDFLHDEVISRGIQLYPN